MVISGAEDEATIAAKGDPRVSLGGATVYGGYQQVSSNNQNPSSSNFPAAMRR
ncbi:MAG: hypothetical protein ACLFTI_08575 [Anaerolineales bacterium]